MRQRVLPFVRNAALLALFGLVVPPLIHTEVASSSDTLQNSPIAISGFGLGSPVGHGAMSIDSAGDLLFLNHGDLDVIGQSTTDQYGATLRASNVVDLTPNGGLHGKLTSVTSLLDTSGGCGLVAIVGAELTTGSASLFARSSSSSPCHFDHTTISSQTFTPVATEVTQPILGLSTDALGNIIALVGSSSASSSSGSLWELATNTSSLKPIPSSPDTVSALGVEPDGTTIFGTTQGQIEDMTPGSSALSLLATLPNAQSIDAITATQNGTVLASTASTSAQADLFAWSASAVTEIGTQIPAHTPTPLPLIGANGAPFATPLVALSASGANVLLGTSSGLYGLSSASSTLLFGVSLVTNVVTPVAEAEPFQPRSITTDAAGVTFVLGSDGIISATSVAPTTYDGTELTPGTYTPLSSQHFGQGYAPIQLVADPQGDLFVSTIPHTEGPPPEFWIIPYGAPGTLVSTSWIRHPVPAAQPALISFSGTSLQNEYAPLISLGLEPSGSGGASTLLLGYLDGSLDLLSSAAGSLVVQTVNFPTPQSSIAAITYDAAVGGFYVAGNDGSSVNLYRVGPTNFTSAIAVSGSFPSISSPGFYPIGMTSDPYTGAVVGTAQEGQSILFAYLPSSLPRAVLLGSSLEPGTTTTLASGIGSATGVVDTPGSNGDSFTITDAYSSSIDGGYLRTATTSTGPTSASAPQITASEDPLSGAINALVTPAPIGPQPTSYEVVSEASVGGSPEILGTASALPCGASSNYCVSVNLGGLSTALPSTTQVTLIAVPLYGTLAGPIGVAPPLALAAIPPTPSSTTLTFAPGANGYASQVVTFVESPESPIPYEFPSHFGVSGPFSLTQSAGTTSCGTTLAAGQACSVSVTPTGTPSLTSSTGSLIYGCTSSNCTNQPLAVFLEALGLNAGTLPSTGIIQSNPTFTEASPTGQQILASTSQSSQVDSSGPKSTSSPTLELASAPPSNTQSPSATRPPHHARPTPTLSFVLSPVTGAPGTTVTLVDHTLPSGCTAPSVLFGSRVVARPEVVDGTFAPLSLSVPGDSTPGTTTITVSCSNSHRASLAFHIVTQSIHINAIDTSVLRPQQISFTPAALAKSAIIALIIIPFVAFPSEILNNTLEEHEEELAAIRRRLRLRRKEGSTANVRWRNNLRLTIALLIAGLLNGFLDPRFGMDLNSLVTFVGLLLGLTFVILASDLPTALFFKKNDPEAILQGHVLPGAIVMAGACVLLSRLVHFEPGYLYGLVAGLQVVNRVTISERDHMRAQLRSFITMLVVSVVAWLLRAPLDHLAGAAHASVLVVGIDAALVSTFIGGLQGVLVGLLPLRFLPGRILYRMHRPAWITLVFISAFLFIHLVLGRGSSYVGSIGGLAAAIALIGGFFLVTFLTWTSFVIYDRRKERREEVVGSRD